MSARLAVVLCPERSGSTLLSMVLGGHSRVLAPPEMHLFRYPDYAAWRAGYPQARDSLSWLLEAIGQDRPSRFSGRRPAEIYRWLLDRAPVDWVVDKTPAYARSAATLQRCEALQPTYIWLVRHPLGVAASRLERRSRQRKAGLDASQGVRETARLLAGQTRERIRTRLKIDLRRRLTYWRDLHQRIEAFLAAVPARRQHRVRFESLVRDPRPVIEGLCQALEVQPEPAMLHPRDNLPGGLEWGIGDEKIRGFAGIEPQVADYWRQHFDDDDVDAATAALWARIG